MTQRPILVRVLWFVFVGWWATPIVVNTAWLLNVTVVLLPIGIKLINLVPTVLTLAEPRSLSEPESARGQRSLAVRAILLRLRRLVDQPTLGERGVVPRNHGRGTPGRDLDAQPAAIRHVAVPVSRLIRNSLIGRIII